MADDGESGARKANVAPHWLKTLWNAYPLVVVSGVVVVTLAFVLGLLWPLTDVIAAHDVGLITGPIRAARLQAAREAVRTQLLTLGAGVFALGALIFTARNFTLSRSALEETRRTVDLTEQGQVTERYTKAIEQLGSDQLDVRIGGLYAMERIARDSARDHPTVMEVLVAFVREHSREQWPLPERGATELPMRSTRPDVQAAITVIGRRDSSRDLRPINLSDAILAHANLTGARLADADFTRAHLNDADLTDANLTRAGLTDAKLTDARLVRADLTDARLVYAYLTRARLPDADLSGADLTNADLTSAHFTGADLTGANLAGADLTGAHLVRAKLIRAILAEARLGDAELTGADLTSAVLINADLTGADLTGADLSGADFPEGAQVPDGWLRDAGSGQLKPATTEPGEGHAPEG
jgi:uncharacterized protein YjbI with pentapeptide repeats